MNQASDALATQFSRDLLNEVGLDTLREIIRRNRRQEDPGVDASHSFCAATEVMARSFRTLFGRSVGITDERDTETWAEAWETAVCAEFWTNLYDEGDGDVV